MIYGLTSNAVSLDDRREIALALETLSRHYNEGTIAHCLEDNENMYCIYCGSELKTWSKTSGESRVTSYLIHQPAPNRPCVGTDHYLGVQNPLNLTARIDNVWRWYNNPSAKPTSDRSLD